MSRMQIRDICGTDTPENVRISIAAPPFFTTEKKQKQWPLVCSLSVFNIQKKQKLKLKQKKNTIKMKTAAEFTAYHLCGLWKLLLLIFIVVIISWNEALSCPKLRFSTILCLNNCVSFQQSEKCFFFFLKFFFKTCRRPMRIVESMFATAFRPPSSTNSKRWKHDTVLIYLLVKRISRRRRRRSRERERTRGKK